ncbi:protein sip-5 [Luteimonas sp. BDR2-5]|uniref:protein sip-5 n=1 Tax=Proluteimonas luteida TaxID=2878685 RepID=UPI001E65084E|nr:protein sip-5 [Luteimonas sp. BDR2-5]MCD9027159.1 protein sip-5 [Luteimonas sp. BDR2-5]
MNFEGLKSRVERAESLVDGRLSQTGDRYAALKLSWREAWTPPRIILAGLIAGFVTGRSQPRDALQKLGKLGGPKSIQLVTSIASMLTSMQAAYAAATAEKAADTADDAANDVQDAAATVQQEAQAPGPATGTAAPSQAAPSTTPEVPDDAPRPDRNRPDPALTAQPPPAEAATDVSEPER